MGLFHLCGLFVWLALVGCIAFAVSGCTYFLTWVCGGACVNGLGCINLDCIIVFRLYMLFYVIT